jgi:hypothetical protein
VIGIAVVSRDVAEPRSQIVERGGDGRQYFGQFSGCYGPVVPEFIIGLPHIFG